MKAKYKAKHLSMESLARRFVFPDQNEMSKRPEEERRRGEARQQRKRKARKAKRNLRRKKRTTHDNT